MPRVEVAQLFPKGLNYLNKKNPQACLVKEVVKWWETASGLEGAVMEVGGSLELLGGTCPASPLGWGQAQGQAALGLKGSFGFK